MKADFIDSILSNKVNVAMFVFGFALIVVTAQVDKSAIDADAFGYCTLLLLELWFVLYSIASFKTVYVGEDSP